ncbi:MAG: hypothetical protein V3W28_05970 [Thermoplasmata archaeon]
MKSDVDWDDDLKNVVCDHGDYEHCSECCIDVFRQVQADAVLEVKQVQRKCWQDFGKRGSTGEYHVMVAKAIEARAKEIKEGK